VHKTKNIGEPIKGKMTDSGVRPEVLIATPAYNGSVTTHYFESMLHLSRVAEDHNIGITVSTISTESLITRARNMFIAQFIDDPKFTHLLFVDADIGFPPEALLDLITADFPVSACPYPRKTYDFNKFKESSDGDIRNCMSYIVNIMHPQEGSEGKGIDIPVFKTHFIQVLEAGTGFMCIKREVIEQMQDAYPELRHKIEHATYGREGWLYGLFDTMVEPATRRYLSEDYAFCKRWRDLGGAVYLNARCNLMHSGNHVFFGQFLKSISYTPPPIVS
jgi:hypothetical protein